MGATSGIAFHTMLEYAKNSDQPKIYVVGRGEIKFANVINELRKFNADGRYLAIKAEISLLKNVDAACDEFQRQEKRLDLLVMCPGYLKLTRRGTPRWILERLLQASSSAHQRSWPNFDERWRLKY